MSEKRQRAEKYSCVCLRCGHVTAPFVRLDDNDLPAGRAKCQKCSNTAYVLGFSGIGFFMAAVAKELVHMRSDIFDLQAAFEPEEER